MSFGLRTIYPEDWNGVRYNFQKLNSSLGFGPSAKPTYAGLTLTGLTANSLIYPNSSKVLTSLGAATDGQIPIGSTGAVPVLAGITGTTNQITVTNSAGSITLSIPQDIHTGATPQFDGLGIGASGSSGSILLQTDGVSDPEFILKTPNNELSLTLDYASTVDRLLIANETEGNSLQVVFDAESGKDAGFLLRSGGGTNYAEIIMQGNTQHLLINNEIQDKDIIFAVDDGGTPKNIRWNADSDTLEHSAGTFNFDDDNIVTTGIINGSDGEVLVEDNATSAPSGKSDGYVGVAEIGGTARLYFSVEGAMYYIDGTAAAVPITGNPIGLLLCLTYNLD